ncbi:hypothetical protein BH18THE2_BH18THE2_23860 [soil metagenome]
MRYAKILIDYSLLTDVFVVLGAAATVSSIAIHYIDHRSV